MLSLRKRCMDTLFPDKLRLLLLSRKPIQLNTLSAWVLVAGTQRYFTASLENLGNSRIHGLHQTKGSSPSSRAVLANNYETRRSPAVSSWAYWAAVVLPSGSNFLQVLEYYFSKLSEYQFLVCRLYGDYPAKECHHYWQPSWHQETFFRCYARQSTRGKSS